jgi:dTDP-4-dehydrorhamnose 3,5-epimerase
MFTFTKTTIPDVILVTPQVFGDERGFFLETYRRSAFFENGIPVDFVQDNRSRSTKGVLRGLHYQKGKSAQAKLVYCTKGEILDVAVDMRKESPTFLRWVGYVLSAENKQGLFIPAEGFAHGFCVLSADAEILYKCSHEYDPTGESGIVWNDPTIGIEWPITDPQLSPKDRAHPTAAELFGAQADRPRVA